MATAPTELKRIGAPEPGSPAWWRDRLLKRLRDVDEDLGRYEAYYIGDHPLALASEEFRSAFQGQLRNFSDNFCQLVVDAVGERLHVEGFRIPTEDGPRGTNIGRRWEGDQQAWEIWQRNNLDAESHIAHTEALVNGVVNVLVWPADDGRAEITVEHPRQTVVETAPGGSRRRRAALKRWLDDGEYLRVNVYLPEGIFKWRSTEPRRNMDDLPTTDSIRWDEWTDFGDTTWPVANPLGVVPMVALPNRPQLLYTGDSELREVIPVQNAVNKIMLDMLIASEYAAFRQRYIIGIDIPRDPESNEVLPLDREKLLKASLERVWMFEGSPEKNAPQPQVGDFAASDLGNYVKALETLVQHIASRTRTPPHYLLGQMGSFPSGESLKSSETGLVAKVRQKMRFFGEGWEEVIRLARQIEGTAPTQAFAAETIWRDPESRTEAEHTDAIMKQQSLRIPNEFLWEQLGYSPQQIERIKQLTAEGATVGPPEAPAAGATPVTVAEPE